MQISTDTPPVFSWQRERSAEELGNFISQRLAALDSVMLELDTVE